MVHYCKNTVWYCFSSNKTCVYNFLPWSSNSDLIEKIIKSLHETIRIAGIFKDLGIIWGRVLLQKIQNINKNVWHSINNYLIIKNKINGYPVRGHFLSKWSKVFIMVPHLSGFEFCAQIVTAGNVNSSIGYVMVSRTVTAGLSYQTGKKVGILSKASSKSLLTNRWI